MNELIRHHIEAIKGRSVPDLLRLTEQLHTGCWPGGVADRIEPGALPWVRRWSPVTTSEVAPLVCLCGDGRCSICN